MSVRCPSCRNQTNELMSCDRCNSIGCTRCVSKHSRQWLCANCRKTADSCVTVQSGDQPSPGPGQAGGFPGWFG